MSKISEKAAYALIHGKKFKENNTIVENGIMKLHGNTIAVKNSDNTITVSLCGWNTPTTRSRLNMLPNISIKSKNGIPYLNGVAISVCESYTI